MRGPEDGRADVIMGGQGGSGGAIWLEAETLAGSGTIRANGGDGSNDCGGGGGGRIAVYSGSPFPGALVAAGGAGFNPGQAGSIYRPTLDAARSSLTARPAFLLLDEQATITVSLVSELGVPLAGQQVSLGLVEGGGVRIGGTAVPAGQWPALGTTGASGTVTTTLAASLAGRVVVRARSGTVGIGQPVTLTVQTSAPPAAALRIEYTYDPLNRLVDARYADGRRFQYTYDAAGNRTQATQAITTTAVTTHYSYDPANRLTAVEGKPYTWDSAGNLLDDGGKRYTYDQADRLVAITSTTGLAWSARYDGDGVRLGQVVNGQAITYTLDLAAPLVTVLAEAQLNKRITYLYGLGDSPLASDDGAAWTYLSGRDALNSVRQETDAAGQVLAARSFDPYGVTLSGDGGAPFGYTGEFHDAASGLLFLRARYLQVTEGRFITRDAWPDDDRRPITLNAWPYAGANPVIFTDPSGRKSCEGEYNCSDSWWQVELRRGAKFSIKRLLDGGQHGQARFGDAVVDIGVPPTVRSYLLADGLAPLDRDFSKAPPAYYPASFALDCTTCGEPGRNAQAVNPRAWKTVYRQSRAGEQDLSDILAGIGLGPTNTIDNGAPESNPPYPQTVAEASELIGASWQSAKGYVWDSTFSLQKSLTADGTYRVIIDVRVPLSDSHAWASWQGQLQLKAAVYGGPVIRPSCGGW